MPKQFYRTETYRAGSSLGYLVRRAYSHMMTKVEEAFAGSDVTLTQWIILINLRDKRMRTAADICQTLNHDSGALTRVLDQLENRGLIERRRSQGDRRVIELSITDAGLQTVERLLPDVVAAQNALLENFTQTEAHTLLSLLAKFVAQPSAAPEAASDGGKEAFAV